MRAYKYSGHKWIGTIPVEWDMIRLGSVYVQRNNKVNTNDFPPLSITMEGVVPQLDYVAKSNDETNRKQVLKGDFVINSRSDRRGSCGVSPMYGSCSVINIVLTSRDKTDVRFFDYALQSKCFPDEFYRWGSGIVADLWSTKWDAMSKIELPYPSFEERCKIADFLDSHCNKIDEIITETSDSIEELKKLKKAYTINVITYGLDRNVDKKESGIVWIPTIPASWEVKKIKRVIFPVCKNVLDTDDIITCFRDGEVTLRKNRRADGYTISYTENGYQGVDQGDLVIHGMDAFAGAIGCSDSRGKTTPVVHVCSTAGNNRYFMYALRNMAYSEVLMDFSNGIRVRSSDYRNFAKLGIFEIPVPPVEEQNRIADYLDQKCELIDGLIKDKENYLVELKEYKKVLIYEYVTGKKEVPQS